MVLRDISSSANSDLGSICCAILDWKRVTEMKKKKAKFPRPKFTWDKEYGLGYVYLKKGVITRTLNVYEANGSYLIVDIDKNGDMLGVEVVS